MTLSGAPSDPSGYEYSVEYFVACMLIFVRKKWRSSIREPGERLVILWGANLRVSRMQRQPALSHATVDCQWGRVLVGFGRSAADTDNWVAGGDQPVELHKMVPATLRLEAFTLIRP